jgi:hypothetical protein
LAGRWNEADEPCLLNFAVPQGDDIEAERKVCMDFRGYVPRSIGSNGHSYLNTWLDWCSSSFLSLWDIELDIRGLALKLKMMIDKGKEGNNNCLKV